MSRLALLITIFAVVAGLGLSGCSAPKHEPIKMAPLSELPDAMQHAPASVRTAYQFAVANPDALANVPCYCGCGAVGHKSNLACYVKGVSADGKPIFDNHALGCSICVDIALDVKKMAEDGKAPGDIRAEIVKTYSAFGPSNQ